MSVPRRFRAFISYSHHNQRVAAWLHRSLEGYRVPKRLCGTSGEFGQVPERLRPIFRDREELASAGALGARLLDALADSDALLVICSPEAACSRWVNEEVLAFKRLGRSDRIYCLIVAGEPQAGDARECFPPALRFEIEPDGQLGLRRAEPIAADIRPGKDGRTLARLKLMAGLLGTDLDKLRQREAQRRYRRMLVAAVASMGGMALALVLATAAWVARNDAQRRQAQAENLLGYMLGDLRQKVENSGRLDALDRVGDQIMDYFASLDSRDLNDVVLGQQAQVLTQLGQVRLREARYPEALASFRSAYLRSKALVERHPGNGDRLFDLGQAEYWIGYVYWQSRKLDRAQQWLARYRDTCRRVYAIDPARTEWQHEFAYGEHNLAVLELERGQLERAGEGFERAQSMLASVQAKTPGDPQLIFEVADEVSWQGNVEEQSGHLEKAAALIASKAATVGRIVAAQPTNPRWQQEWSSAESMQSELLRVLGDYAQAETLASGAIERMRSLIAQDSANKDWSEAYLRALELRAAARIGAGKPAAANDDLALAQPLIDALAHDADNSRLVQRDILDALSLRATLALQAGDHAAALVAANALQALYHGKAMPDSPENIGRYGLCEVISGMAAAAAGQIADANAHYAAARRALAPLARASRYWRVLDPWVRLSLLTGNLAEAARVQAQLAGFGYIPSIPWPTVAAAGASNRSEAPMARYASAQPEIPRQPGGSRSGRKLSDSDRPGTDVLPPYPNDNEGESA
ncbi:MAG: toll/interleukin-1 receptor domain-containing protein [Gammaproteobacteria bacterium]|nr:toll/interleukin-1 receptor domain-containing protein [Gammaproteobacteria bacterium]